MQEETKIKVCIRSRQLSEREMQDGNAAWKCDGNCVTMYGHDNKPVPGSQQAFDQVFDESATTESIYSTIAQPIITSCVRGFNGTIFAYGQTSSGKTFTMAGTEGSPGIIPRAVDELFTLIQQDAKREYLVRVSYVEIYNEVINDLLQPDSSNLKVMEDIDRGVFVADLKEELALSPEHVMELMTLGSLNRATGATSLNDKSSRSHAIFRLMIESRAKAADADEDGAVWVSCLNLVDLAGSERASMTHAEGQRLKEGCHINKSLLTLGQVITKLSEGQGRHIPYRDSKLTRLLQPALGGNARTAIICTITPARRHAEETLSTLKFANRAKDVTNTAQINEVVDDATLMKRLQKEILDLKAKLDSEGGESESVSSEQVESLRRQNTELTAKMEKLQKFFREPPSLQKHTLPKFRHSVAPSSMFARPTPMSDMFAHKRKITTFDEVPPSKKRLSSAQPSEMGEHADAKKNERLNIQLTAARSENEKLMKQIRIMEEELDQLEAQQKVRVVQVDDTEVERLRQERVRLLQEALMKCEACYAEVGPQRKQFQELELKLKRGEDREIALQRQVEQLRQKDATSDGLRSEVALLKAQLVQKDKDWQSKEKQWRSERSQMKVELMTVQKSNTLLQRQSDKSSKEDSNVKELKQRIARLEKSTAEAEASKNDAVSAMTVAEEAQSELRQRIVEIETASSAIQMQLNESEAARQSLSAECNSLRAQVAELKDGMESAQAEADHAKELSAKIATLETEKNRALEMMVESNFKQEEEKEQWAMGEADLMAKLDSTTSQRDAAMRVSQDAQDRVDVLQKEKESILQKLKDIPEDSDRFKLRMLQTQFARTNKELDSMRSHAETVLRENKALRGLGDSKLHFTPQQKHLVTPSLAAKENCEN